jgi:hypothetical protein
MHAIWRAMAGSNRSAAVGKSENDQNYRLFDRRVNAGALGLD